MHMYVQFLLLISFVLITFAKLISMVTMHAGITIISNTLLKLYSRNLKYKYLRYLFYLFKMALLSI